MATTKPNAPKTQPAKQAQVNSKTNAKPAASKTPAPAMKKSQPRGR